MTVLRRAQRRTRFRDLEPQLRGLWRSPLDLLIMVSLLGVVLAGCASVNRPEGTVERFADAVSRGVNAELVNDLGTRDAADGLLGRPYEPSDHDQENLDSVEAAPAISVTDDTARVPVLVTRADDPDEPVRLEARLRLREGSWYVVAFEALTVAVVFPGEGGPGIVENTSRLAVLIVAVSASSLVFSVAVIRIVGGRRPGDVTGSSRLSGE